MRSFARSFVRLQCCCDCVAFCLHFVSNDRYCELVIGRGSRLCCSFINQLRSKRIVPKSGVFAQLFLLTDSLLCTRCAKCYTYAEITDRCGLCCDLSEKQATNLTACCTISKENLC